MGLLSFPKFGASPPPPSFFPSAAEPFLAESLPQFDDERKELVIRIISTVMLFIFLIPYVATQLMHRRKAREASQSTKAEDDEELVALPWYTMPMLNYFSFAGVILLALNSSNNAHTPRAIFEAPFLTAKECASIINLFDTNSSHKSNVLSLIENEFSQDVTSFLEDKLNGRLGPLIERVYGVTTRSMSALELSIVRLTSQTETDVTRIDEDASHLIFSVVLGGNFKGGSHRFYHRPNNVSQEIVPEVGSVLIHDGDLGYTLPSTVGKGEMYVFKGKLQVTMKDATDSSTGLSLFASFLSTSWLQGRSRQVSRGELSLGWFDNFVVRSCCRVISSLLQNFTDRWAPHFHKRIAKNSESALKLLDTLDSKRIRASREHYVDWFGKDSDEKDDFKRHEEL